jgi:cytoskeleton protein RodZ
MFPSPRDEALVAEIGITLRNGRVQRGLTIDQVAQETRISPRFLEALEAEAFDELPAPVYVRGFLRSYANFLHLDATPLLEQLTASGSAPIGGPDGFVRGPSTSAQGRKPSSNPFRPAAPVTRPQAQSRGAPPSEPIMPVSALAQEGDEVDEGWAPERLAGAFDEEPAMVGRSYPPNPQLDDLEPEPGYAEPQPRYRARGASGILLERDGAEGGGGGSTRMLAIAAGGVIVLLFFLAVAVLLTRGGGGSNAEAPTNQSPTATSRPGTVISALGTQTGVAGTPTAAGSATASPSPSASASQSPSATTTAAPTTAVNNTATASTPTPTATPTESPTVAPTATTRPPTPALPTPTPIPSHPSGYGLCVGPANCGDSPFTVVCPPDNQWYIDPTGGSNNPYHWPTHLIVFLKDASCP